MNLKERTEMLADLYEALENVRKWKPLYMAVLKQTGDREQAKKAVRWAIKMEKEKAAA